MQDLVERARGGDAAALSRLMLERRAEVVRYAMRLCISSEDAEDATQEALLALARYARGLREVAALSRWLFLAVRTHCLRLARRSLRHALGQGDGDGWALEGPTPEEQFADRQLRERLGHVLAGLDPLLRDVLIRRDILGQSAADAAAELGLTLPALKSRLHRGRAQARQALLASLAETQRSRRFRESSAKAGGSSRA
ncbi:MAG TPA: sigma-70 family RNA polymerase sigma factor [Polyangiaceae bacterium]|nr:sigma-70 family RNA polymerase sigma factor [Polyangiaceae bacterium]